MQTIYSPLELAIARHQSQLPLPAEERDSLRKISTDFAISHSTLSRRLSGTSKSYSESHSHLQALSNDEETALIDHIRRYSITGHPPQPGHVLELANEIRRNRVPLPASLPSPSPSPSSLLPLGIGWLGRFRARHPQVSSVWSRQLETARVDAITLENLAPWFAEIGSLCEQHRYPPEAIFNTDETGYGMGTMQSTRVMVQRPSVRSPGRNG